MTVKITLTENGPLRIEGDVDIRYPSGARVESKSNVHVFCRCGGSQNKPFCDGTHKRNGFSAPEPDEIIV